MGSVVFEEHIIFILGNTTSTSFPRILKASTSHTKFNWYRYYFPNHFNGSYWPHVEELFRIVSSSTDYGKQTSISNVFNDSFIQANYQPAIWLPIVRNYEKHRQNLPAFQGTLAQILRKQLPCDQNLHHSLACECKAFSRHISSFHNESNPVKETKKIHITALSI